MANRVTLTFPDEDHVSANAIYYADLEGVLRWWNPPFDDFAHANGVSELGPKTLGTRILDSFSGVHRARWQAIYAQLVSGRTGEYIERFQCPSPYERRDFVLKVKRIERNGQQMLRHETFLQPAKVEGNDAGGPRMEWAGRLGKGVRFAACERPLEEKSGDGVWVRQMEDGRSVLVIADAMGHGAGAAVALAFFFKLLESEMSKDPVGALARVNSGYISQEGFEPGTSPFITGLLVTVPPVGDCLEIQCFGHHGVILSPGGPTDIPGGLPIGILEGYSDWPVEVVELSRVGNRVLAYTDGIVEQFDPTGEMYGDDNLNRDFSMAASLSLPESLTCVLTNMDRWRKTALVKDDQTMLAIQLTG